MKKHKITKLAQNSPEWLTWRESGIGASEMSVIMGSLPFSYETVLDLWKKKTKIMESDFVVNEAMQAGIDLEPEARDVYGELVGYKVKPECFSHPEHSFLRASLDGICSKGKRAVEIKCPGIVSFKKALGGGVLDYYYTQIQQQLLCSGAEYSDYWVYRRNTSKYSGLTPLDLATKYRKGVEDGAVLIRVPRNEEYMEEIIRRGKIFWDLVEAREPALPRHFGIDLKGYSQPFRAGEMKTELLAVYEHKKEA